MAVHRAVARRRSNVDEAAFFRVRKDVIDAAIDLLAIRTAAGSAARADERHAGQPTNGDVAAIAAGAERAVVVLPGGEKIEGFLDGFDRLGREHFRARFFRVGAAIAGQQPTRGRGEATAGNGAADHSGKRIARTCGE